MSNLSRALLLAGALVGFLGLPGAAQLRFPPVAPPPKKKVAPKPVAPPPKPPPPLDLRLGIVYEDFKLPNGLRVLLSRDNAVPVVSLCLVYGAGSSVEEPGHTGYAHLIEQMMTQNAAAEGSGYAKYVEANGGRIAGSAHPGYSIYSTEVPSNQLAPVLWMESARMRDLPITTETLAAARQAIAAERHRLFAEQGYNAARLELWPALVFANPRNARSVMGSPEDLDAATVEDVSAFFRVHYAPGNAILALAGDFPALDVRKMVEQSFGSIPPQGEPPPRPDLAEPARTAGRIKASQDPHVGVPGVIIGWPAPERHSPAWYGMRILEGLLTEGLTARLRLDLVEGRRSLVRLESNIGWPFETAESSGGPAEFALSMLYRPGLRSPQIVAEIQQEIDSVAIEGVDNDELGRVKGALRLNAVTRLQSSSNRAMLLAQYALLDGDPAWIEKDFAALLAVTGAQVQAVAHRLTTAPRRDVLFIDPVPVPPRGAPAAPAAPKKNP